MIREVFFLVAQHVIMKQPHSEELLSAYIDGELSAQERAEVERWLERSAHPGT